MKKFDLQKAIEGHPLETRDGRKVLEFHYFKNASEDDHYHIAALIQERDSPDVKLLTTFTKNGHVLASREYSPTDLFLAPVKKTYWMNVHKRRDGRIYNTGIFESEKESNEFICNDERIKTLSFEVEE